MKIRWTLPMLALMTLPCLGAEKSATKITEQQRQELVANAPKYFDQVDSIFRAFVGRDATKDERSHFGALLAFGISPYEIESLVRSTQEHLVYQRRLEQNQFVAACLGTFDNQGRNYNEEWHEEIENRAIQCADRLMNKLDQHNRTAQQ